MSKPEQHQSTVGQEIDALVAEKVLNYSIIRQRRGGIKERTIQGLIRPLRAYTRDMNAAWEIAEKMQMVLVPLQDGTWFCIAGKPDGWASPADLMQYIAERDFSEGGAAVQPSAPLAICIAALTAVEKRQAPKLAIADPPPDAN